MVGVGGDGTVSEVVTGLVRAGRRASWPSAAADRPGRHRNSTYRGLWNDEPWAAVAGLALRGQAVARRIDLARIEQNGDLVVLGSGSGLFAASLLAIRNRPERGRELLMAAALAAMETYVPYPGRVSVDGEVLYEGDIVETIVAASATAAGC
ncbi:hypothetical protein GXW82_09905 [Streptacidiphilus sp. 4-A2]|nr:hypothetical protein [Streptacidiphilus sp. 4-A2]